MVAIGQMVSKYLSPSQPHPPSSDAPPLDDAVAFGSSESHFNLPGAGSLHDKVKTMNKHIGITAAECRSVTASSSELFGMLKAMAMGGNDDETGEVDVDSDEDEDGDVVLPGKGAKGSNGMSQHKQSGLSHTESSATIRPNRKAESTVPDIVEEDDAARRDTRQKWMEETTGRNRSDGQASRFAALSLSNLSPLTNGQSAAQPRGNKKRPPLPRPASAIVPDSDVEPEHPELGPITKHDGESEQTSATPDSGSSTPSTAMTMPSMADFDDEKVSAHFAAASIPDEEKLKAIVEEYGDMANLLEGVAGGDPEPERILAESKGSLFKGVMMVGNLHLTTHRLLFHALLPPDSALVSQKLERSGETNGVSIDSSAAASKSHLSDIMQAGPVTVHRPGALKSARRVWMELSADMITTYPSGDDSGRVRPLSSVLLSSVRRLEPLDEGHPCDIIFTYDFADGLRRSCFTVDTEQSSVQWRRQLESALFRHARMKWRHNEAAKRGVKPDEVEEGLDDGDNWTMMRCCVPLDRVSIQGVSDYHSFATLVSLDIELDDQQAVHWQGEQIAQGDFSANESSEQSRKPSRATSTGAKGTSGLDEPRRSFSGNGGLPLAKHESRSSRRTSFKASLPFVRSNSNSSNCSRTSSPDGQTGRTPPAAPSPLHPLHRDSTTWIDSSLPPRLAMANRGASTSDSLTYDPGSDWRNSFDFNVAVLNEQQWFTEALQAAVSAAADHKYKAGATRPKMSLDIAGYDCLASDEDLEPASSGVARTTSTVPEDGGGTQAESGGIQAEGGIPPASAPSSEEEDHVGKSGHPLSHAMRKAQKAAMAAKMFGLNEDEGIWLKRCFVSTPLFPARGHIILTPKFVCFWRRANIGSDIKYRFKTDEVKDACESTTSRPGFHGMALQVQGHHDVLFEFWRKESRNEVISRIKALCGHAVVDSALNSSPTPSPSLAAGQPMDDRSINTASQGSNGPTSFADAPVAEGVGVPHRNHAADILAPPKDAMFHARAFPDEALGFMPFVANKPWAATSMLTPRRFTCLTIGSRGDVQPYIALGLRLMKDGHKVTIVTHNEFKKWIEGYGIEHRQAGGDPTALMKLSTEHKMFSPGFFKESLGSFRGWLDDLLLDSWDACRDADVLIESPSTMSGIHIAEALDIPYFRAFTMPWTRTTAYPQAFMVPAFEVGPSFNYSTYVLFDNIIWRATSGQINRWRKKHLNLKSTDMSALSISKVPFLYNFSSAVVPKPLDWHDDITITGYWNLENSDSEWTPPEDLVKWMAKAKEDGKPIIYIGFGSIVVPRPNSMTKSIIRGVEKADVRAIIAKGWASRGGDPSKEGEHIEFPPSCYGLEKVPHGWLFPKIQAALHHGGAGTVGASLRAGIPTLIKPWFGDQFFWAGRVTKLEVGLKVASLRSDDVADALKKATTNKVMIEKAASVGERIRVENGVDNALQAIHFNILRAGSDRTKMSWAK